MIANGHNFLLVMAALLLLPGLPHAATITVHADRNPAVLQESFRLIFEATGDVDDNPDFSPLEQDFQLLSTSTSTSMSIVNTKITSTRQWRLTLIPLRAGKLSIPAISFGRDQSPSTLLTVAPTRSGPAGQDAPDVFLDVRATPQSAYVQQQVIYTVELYRAVATANETLSEPATEQGNAIIELLDADQSYDTLIRGRRYTVFARSYGIYPQGSGSLLIRPVRFQAQLSTRSPFGLDPFGTGGSTVARQSEAIELQIKPIPGTYQGGHWLPATEVKITEKWSKKPYHLLPNEPVTRTLMITAQGLTASQLPEIRELLPDNFRQYPAQPELENRKTATGITGVRQQKNALIPRLPGEYSLPEISLPWWNVETQTLEYAVLPERRVQVATAAPDATVDTPLPAVAGTDAQAQGPAVSAAGETATTGAETATAISIWQWLSAILAVAWVTTLAYILKRRSRPQAAAPQRRAESLGAIRGELKRACRDGEPEAAKTALLRWAGAHPERPSATSLGDLEKQVNERLAGELCKLSRRLYARTTASWRGAELWQAFLQEEKTTVAPEKPRRGELEPLFKL